MSRKNKQPTPSSSLWGYLSGLLRGEGVSVHFFLRHWGVIVVVMTFVMLSITNKYYCQTSMEQIRALNKDLEVVKTERIRAKSIYMSRTRESSMQTLIDSLDLGLGVQTHPPYIITTE